MKRRFRTVCMGLAVHMVLSGAALAAVRVGYVGYNRTHEQSIRAASVRLDGDTAEVSLLTDTLRIPLPEPDDRLYLVSFAAAGEPFKGWVWLLGRLIEWS